jgi:hypothetical protein
MVDALQHINHPGGNEGPVETEHGLNCRSKDTRCKHLAWHDYHYPYCSAQAADTLHGKPQTYPWPGAGLLLGVKMPNKACPYLKKDK